MSYMIPTQILETTLEVKKSLFHCRAGEASDRAQAMALLEQCRNDYPDARHHCWAYLFGPPQNPTSVAMSDDGEPSGTAGKPILNVLQHGDIGNVMLVVSRYFGGIKLGAGGLVRAYSSATTQTLSQLSTRKQVDMLDVSIVTEFKHEQFFYHFVKTHQGKVTQCEYTQRVIMSVSIPASNAQALNQAAATVSATLSYDNANSPI